MTGRFGGFVGGRNPPFPAGFSFAKEETAHVQAAQKRWMRLQASSSCASEVA